MGNTPVGRFAPTPSGRMHLGNLFTALLSWLSVRAQGGALILRMEDLDTLRTKEEYAAVLRDDLRWLGLHWDLETQKQSLRSAVYDRYFDILHDRLYPCYCTRSQRINAPHLSDGNYVYPGTCAQLTPAQRSAMGRAPCWRIRVPEKCVSFTDRVQGLYRQNLARECGDFIVRRADGVYVYQLAVTVDDGESGVTEVVRGADLLSSTPRQMYLQNLLGFHHPVYAHVPLLLAPDGRRLSKRDADLDMGALRKRFSPEQILGRLACAAGLIDRPEPVSASQLVPHFRWEAIKKESIIVDFAP